MNRKKIKDSLSNNNKKFEKIFWEKYYPEEKQKNVDFLKQSQDIHKNLIAVLMNTIPIHPEGVSSEIIYEIANNMVSLMFSVMNCNSKVNWSKHNEWKTHSV